MTTGPATQTNKKPAAGNRKREATCRRRGPKEVKTQLHAGGEQNASADPHKEACTPVIRSGSHTNEHTTRGRHGRRHCSRPRGHLKHPHREDIHHQFQRQTHAHSCPNRIFWRMGARLRSARRSAPRNRQRRRWISQGTVHHPSRPNRPALTDRSRCEQERSQFEPRLDSDSAHVRPRHAARSHARNRPTTAIPFGGARTSASKAEIAEAFALICAARASTSRASAAMARLVMANTDRRVAGRAGASGGLATGWLLRPRPHNVPRHIVAEVLTADRSSGFALDANAKGLTRTSVSAGHKVQIPGSAFNAPREISAGRPRAKLLVPISAEVHSPTVVFTIVAVNSVCYFRARKRTRIIGA